MLSCIFACVQIVVGFSFQMTSWPGLEFPCPQYSKPWLQVRGETSELLPPLWAYQLASHGCPQIREVAGASLTSHTPLLLVTCLEAAALRPSCSMSTHRGPGSRVPEEASRGEVLGAAWPSGPSRAQAAGIRAERWLRKDSGLSVGSYQGLPLTKAPWGYLGSFTYFFSDHSENQAFFTSPGCQGAQV